MSPSVPVVVSVPGLDSGVSGRGGEGCDVGTPPVTDSFFRPRRRRSFEPDVCVGKSVTDSFL